MLPLLAIQGALGVGQMLGGLLMKNKRPTYNIPQEYFKNVGESEQMAREGLSESQYTRGLQNIGRNQAGALRMASALGGGSAFRALSNITRQSNEATGNLDFQDAQARRNNMLLAMQQRGVLGQQQLAKQQWDKFDNYKEKAQAKQALIGGGLKNMFGALSSDTGMKGMGAIGDIGSNAQGINRGYGAEYNPMYSGGYNA